MTALTIMAATLLAAGQAHAEDIAWDKVIGADTAKLDDAQRTRVAQNLARLQNTRGCRGTLAACLAEGDQTARRHAGFVVRMVRKKKPDDAIAAGIKQRADSAFPEETFEIDLAGHPSVGARGAKVVIVEYACFQCPYCAHLAPKLKKLQKEFGGKVAHYYKFFPVRSHDRGVATALAGLAAMRQDRFWEMYSLMYANRSDLDDDDLLRYAKDLKLDLVKFEKDLKDPALMKFIEKDKLEGMRLGVEGTPTFFVNGKLFEGASDYEEVVDRLGEELDIVEGRIK
jgi:protein-disulfide isomerase